MPMHIHGRNILITGASSGIGAALAADLDRRGGRLALLARRAPALAGHLHIRADLSIPEDRARAAGQALQALGGIDILINNAGVGAYAPSWKMSMEDVRRMFEVNLFAAIDLTQRLTPGMVQRKAGLVVNVASIAGKVTLPWFTLYSSSKAALEAFTRGLRVELRGTGVSAMLVCPGYVKTKFQESVLCGSVPPRLAHQKRFASTAEEVARAIADGIESGRRTVLTPAVGWALVAASFVAPGLVDERLAGMMGTAGDE
jgi:short-subunit dehydrogenase